ncbi:wall-associated receptor kinase-like 1 [Eucalyptus grandis]|uniref:wall-associated receptor kinase-like 1 n=1 Tax=Eucalyptus grandis TaxID=71139 RepID=UPI00192E93AE|nr:wall-associated receptor kinase-like 1 [Eucalyptus grandis]
MRDTVVVVKKPKDVDRSLLNKDFQDQLEILMNISCKNVVKLKGICLETRIPSLVYEYIPNGTLFQFIHQNESTISWEKCFKIATQAALALHSIALDYMHSKKQSPIFHGNIKSVNILLDQNNSVKISDFGTSILISPEHRHIVATQKKDSWGYIDPEYFVTGMLTPQSDVYSFGVVLVELLTRKKLHVTESGKSINTIHRFISSVKVNKFSDVINFEGASEDEMERVRTVAKIAVNCLDQSGANRPTMSDVAQQLASINPSSTVEEENEEPEPGEDPRILKLSFLSGNGFSFFLYLILYYRSNISNNVEWAKFKNDGFPQYLELCIVFGGTYATEDYAIGNAKDLTVSEEDDNGDGNVGGDNGGGNADGNNDGGNTDDFSEHHIDERVFT